MEPVLIGYFPKKVAVPDFFRASNLQSICSVSSCIAEGPPDGWIDRWLHNEYGLFSTCDRALEVLPTVGASDFSIHAYRLLPLEFKDGQSNVAPVNLQQPTWELDQAVVQPLPKGYRSVGFDAVELPEGCMYFGCSPLSCNDGWKEFETNAHCLVNEMSRAIELAAVFSGIGGWEPGPYRVVEVLVPSESIGIDQLPRYKS